MTRSLVTKAFLCQTLLCYLITTGLVKRLVTELVEGRVMDSTETRGKTHHAKYWTN
jgi:hypothetical protein